MSHGTVQRVAVRMLYDADFAAAVYADSARALAGLEVTATEQAWLVAPDARAWRADPFRRARSLSALLEELPAAGALVIKGPGGPARADAYFSAPEFHDVIQLRGSMAGGFAAYLARLEGDARVAPLARLEGAIARVRRELPRRPRADGRLSRAPGLAVVAVPEGTLELMLALRERLAVHGPTVVGAILDPRCVLGGLPGLGANVAPLLIERGSGDAPAVSEASEELAEILEFAGEPRTRAELLSALERLGAGADEAPEILDGFVADGLLL